MSDQMTKVAGDVTEGLENPQVLNKALMDQIVAASDGEVKSASAAGTNMIRRRIREEGFTRRIIPPQTVTNDDLDRVLEHDRPVIIEDMEPLSPGAKSIPFGDSADTQFYYGNKYACVFNPITTPEWTKDINELRTYRMDLRQVITDNSLKDMQTEEDGKFIAMVDEIVGSTAGVGAAGVQQNFNISGGITRDTYVEVLSKLEDQNLNNGIFLMNRRTAKEFIKFDRNEFGGDKAQDLFLQGLSALQEASILGTKHIFTIKRDLVPDNVVYLFTEPGFFGKFYTLQEVTMYVEKKKDILRFSARETISVTIANVAGCAKVNFLP
jgi:hypothetical protein